MSHPGFVGLTEAFNASVCLFHRIYGGAPSRKEFTLYNAGDHATRPHRRLDRFSLSAAVPPRAQLEWTERALGDFVDDIDPASLEVLSDCKLEPALADTPVGATVQFERLGYFCADPDTAMDRPVFNRTLGLRDQWARLQAQGKAG